MTTGYNRSIFSTGTTTYKDLDMSFRENPSTGDLRTKSDVESIKQSVKNLLLTNYGDVPFRPRKGGNLNHLLFEPFDTVTRVLLDTSIRNTIALYEPRVQIIKLDISQNQNDKNDLDISFWFNIINFAQPQNVVVMLKRVR